MPIGLQRLNAKKSQPNPHIVFIKPLKGPDESIAQDFLEKIAAQCGQDTRNTHLKLAVLADRSISPQFP
jgi:DNA-dependent metalloprotease WSS1